MEAVVALPDQLFYNTGLSTYIWIVSNHKAKRRKGKIQPHVRPHVPDAWIDESKTKVGYEIPLTRHFYKYTQLRPLDEIEKEILELEDKIQGKLGEVLS